MHCCLARTVQVRYDNTWYIDIPIDTMKGRGGEGKEEEEAETKEVGGGRRCTRQVS